MPTTTQWAGARPQILVLGAGRTVPEVEAALHRRSDVGSVETGHLHDGADVAAADLVVVVVDEEPDAVDAVSEVRSETDRPIVVVAGPRPDRFAVFDAGADDVATSPVDPEELNARVRVRLARSSRGRDAIRHGPLVIDPARRVVTLHGDVVSLTAREFDLLAHLAQHPGQAFRRDELLERVWQSSIEWQQARTVTEHVRRLRRKLGDGWIATVHGVGYCFERRDGGAGERRVGVERRSNDPR